VIRALEPPEPDQRVIVVSPHLDDGVLSLGAAMSSWARTGARVELLTVLACDPASDAPTGGWDRRGGFATEGESALARRSEDAAACAIIGATPTWLPFGSVDYDRHGDEGSVVEAVAAQLRDADVVLLPGFPLSHPDHAWLVRAIVERHVVSGRLGYYAEQPYSSRATAAPVIPPWLSEEVGFAGHWVALPRSSRHLVAKWRAVRCYRSQLPLLAVTGLRSGGHALAWQRELVAQGRPD
jgi:LmbE family N-acetylglucosaminyl deacetylase